MHKVIKYFTDLQDNGHVYNVGDSFPRKGVTVSEARIKELAGAKNKQGTPLIAEVVQVKPVDKPVEVPAKEEKPVEEEKPAKKRTRKKNAE